MMADSVVERVVTIEEVRNGLGEMAGRAAFAGERYVITRHGKQIAALVPITDLERLRERSAKPASAEANDAADGSVEQSPTSPAADHVTQRTTTRRAS